MTVPFSTRLAIQSWGYELIDRGGVVIIECKRVGCRQHFTFPSAQLEPEEGPKAVVAWTLGQHMGSHFRKEDRE